jgi:hypothetical protein
MRQAAFTTLVFVAFGFAANAQLSITPKIGAEQFKTNINYNDVPSFSPLGSVFSPQLALRMDYKFKKTHGPFIGAAMNRSVTAFSFADPETGAYTYDASRGSSQIRLEAGYQYSFKPILFKSSSSNSKSQTTASSTQKSGCRSQYSSRCGSKSSTNAKNKSMYMRITPFAGMAYVPGTKSAITADAVKGYTYNAGNFNTAVIAGADFEFGRGRNRQFVVGFQYLKGLGNMNTQTIEAASSTTKASVAHLSSSTSGWNVTLGLPITLGKTQKESKPAKVYMPVKSKTYGQCSQYKRSRCGN